MKVAQLQYILIKPAVQFIRFHSVADNTKDDKSKKYEYICKKCDIKGNIHDYFCSGCHFLKDPSMLKQFNYFELFGMYIKLSYREAKYNGNKTELDKRYHNLQRALHPDRYVDKSKELMDLATEYSTYINMAYRVLKDDEKRAKYLVYNFTMNIVKAESGKFA